LSPVHACWTRAARTISGIPASRKLSPCWPIFPCCTED